MRAAQDINVLSATKLAHLKMAAEGGGAIFLWGVATGRLLMLIRAVPIELSGL